MFWGISQDIYTIFCIFFYDIVDFFGTVGWKNLVVNCFSGAAVCDTSAVKGKDVTSIIFQMQLFCQRDDSFCGTSAGKDNFFSSLLDFYESFQGWLCDFFFGVGKSSVQVKGENLILHKYVLLKFYNSSRACTICGKFIP